MADGLLKDADILDPELDRLVGPTSHRGDIQCGTCRYPISSSDQRIEVSGQHEHHCVNPLGYRFNIGCFNEALGCSISGSPAGADSWFPRFRWQYASCARCVKHLGWYFQDAGGAYFYGLILDRITSSHNAE